MRMLVSTKGCTQHINQKRAATPIRIAIGVINRHLHSDHTGVGAPCAQCIHRFGR